jgi:hypothetical protein
MVPAYLPTGFALRSDGVLRLLGRRPGPRPGGWRYGQEVSGVTKCGGLFPTGSWLSRGLSAGVARGGGRFFSFSRHQGGALSGPVPVWVQLGPPHPPHEGAVPDSPVQNKMKHIASWRVR